MGAGRTRPVESGRAPDRGARRSAANATSIRLKRVYESVDKDDGYRVLVDRLWPRGISKAGAAVDLWLSEAAPSTALRVWFNHDPAKWTEFRTRYHAELGEHEGTVASLLDRARKGTLTLVYAARDERHNHAVALREFLQARLRRRADRSA